MNPHSIVAVVVHGCGKLDTSAGDGFTTFWETAESEPEETTHETQETASTEVETETETETETEATETGLTRLDCDKVGFDWTGDLAVTKVEELSAFAGVRTVSGSVRMYWFEGESYSGLECLERVDGDADFGGRYLNDISALGALRHVGGDFTLSGTLVTNVDALDPLFEGEFEGYIQISYNPELTSLGALSGLTSVTGALALTSQPSGYVGLETIRHVGGSLYLGNLRYAGADLRGLEGLEFVGGDLDVSLADPLTSLAGLDNLREVGGTLILSGNPSLTDLTALRNLERVGSLELVGNDTLTNVDGLEGIQEVERLELVDGIENLRGLSGLRVVHDDLFLVDTDLTDLSDLTALESVGSLTIYSHDRLTSLAGLENVTHLDYLGLSFVSTLDDLSGLSGLEEVGILSIDFHGPAGMGGMTSLREVDSLLLTANRWLEDLEAFSGVESVNNLDVISNSALVSVSGMRSLRHLGNGTMYYNPSLAACDVDLLKAQLEAAGAKTVWSLADLDHRATCK
jgi:hypothetical protein